MQQWMQDWEATHEDSLPLDTEWWEYLSRPEQMEWARARAEHLKYRQLAKQAERRHNRLRQRGGMRARRAA